VNSLSDGMSNLTTDDATSNAPPAENGSDEAGS
jgi:plastin-1